MSASEWRASASIELLPVSKWTYTCETRSTEAGQKTDGRVWAQIKARHWQKCSPKRCGLVIEGCMHTCADESGSKSATCSHGLLTATSSNMLHRVYMHLVTNLHPDFLNNGE